MIDISGQRFGRLTVLEISRRERLSRGTLVFWKCGCDCGNTIEVRGQALRTGTTKSCGCLRNELTGDRSRTHGRSKTPTHNSWRAMRERCQNPKNVAYKNYGGRGISVCKRWEEFEGFLEDMGERPEGTTLERRDVQKGYSPDNCVWLEAKKQCENTTRSRKIEFNGETRLLRDWAKSLGITSTALSVRLRRYPKNIAMTRGRYDFR